VQGLWHVTRFERVGICFSKANATLPFPVDETMYRRTSSDCLARTVLPGQHGVTFSAFGLAAHIVLLDL